MTGFSGKDNKYLWSGSDDGSVLFSFQHIIRELSQGMIHQVR